MRGFDLAEIIHAIFAAGLVAGAVGTVVAGSMLYALTR